MGFMDKAKKLADQAQAKLDEAQKQFNERQGQDSGQQGATPPVEYDQHGRRVTSAEGASSRAPQAETTDTETPQGDPLAQPVTPATPPSAPVDKSPDVRPEPSDTEPPHGDPLRTGEDASRHGADADAPSRPGPPPSGGSGMSSGDPLAG